MKSLNPIAKCDNPDCGAVFPAAALSLAGVRGVTFNGVGTDCPHCGGQATVLDGTFDFVGDVATLLSGPKSTRDILEKLAGVVKASIDAGESTEKTLSRAYEILPTLRRFALTGRILVGALRLALEAHGLYSLATEISGYAAAQDRAQQVSVYREEKERENVEAAYAKIKAQPGQESAEPQQPVQPDRLGLHPYRQPMLGELPITIGKLTEYNKRRREE